LRSGFPFFSLKISTQWLEWIWHHNWGGHLRIPVWLPSPKII
jgi:hypothetical protein